MVTRSAKIKSEKKLPSNDGMATRTLSLRAYANKSTNSATSSTKKPETEPMRKGIKIESVTQKIKGKLAAETKTATRGRSRRGKNTENTSSLRRSSRSIVLEKEQFIDHKIIWKICAICKNWTRDLWFLNFEKAKKDEEDRIRQNKEIEEAKKKIEEIKKKVAEDRRIKKEALKKKSEEAAEAKTKKAEVKGSTNRADHSEVFLRCWSGLYRLYQIVDPYWSQKEIITRKEEEDKEGDFESRSSENYKAEEVFESSRAR